MHTVFFSLNHGFQNWGVYKVLYLGFWMNRCNLTQISFAKKFHQVFFNFYAHLWKFPKLWHLPYGSSPNSRMMCLSDQEDSKSGNKDNLMLSLVFEKAINRIMIFLIDFGFYLNAGTAPQNLLNSHMGDSQNMSSVKFGSEISIAKTVSKLCSFDHKSLFLGLYLLVHIPALRL